MMLASGKSYTRESLIADVITRFGADARFHTCAAEDMAADALVDFLEAHGKFVPRPGGFQTSAHLMCNH